jgi:hypothetical protein
VNNPTIPTPDPEFDDAMNYLNGLVTNILTALAADGDPSLMREILAKPEIGSVRA